MKQKKFKESETIELKKSTAELKEALKSIVAILNKHQSGKLYFGIKNNGDVVGQHSTERTVREVSTAIASKIDPVIYPSVEELKIDGKLCLKVSFSGNDVPYFVDGREYIRVGDEDRRLERKELEEMIMVRKKRYWDSDYATIKIGEIKDNVLRDYIKKGKSAGRITFLYKSKEAALKKLGLLQNRKIKNAAQVLFSDQDNIEVQAAVFASTTKATFLDIKMFCGTLFSLLQQMESYITERINWKAEIKDFKRIEIPEIPLAAIREALVNSLCHRDYQKPESNKIAIFKDRIEIWNPGRFPESLKPEDYIKGEEESILRNPLIAKLLYYSKDIETWGTGLKRIYEECMANNVRVIFKNTKEGFKVVFYKTTPKIQQEIMTLITKNPQITKEEIAKAVGITIDGVKYHLKKLQQVKWHGPSKGGNWIIQKS